MDKFEFSDLAANKLGLRMHKSEKELDSIGEMGYSDAIRIQRNLIKKTLR